MMFLLSSEPKGKNKSVQVSDGFVRDEEDGGSFAYWAKSKAGQGRVLLLNLVPLFSHSDQIPGTCFENSDLPLLHE
jgi:hypothetical protein